MLCPTDDSHLSGVIWHQRRGGKILARRLRTSMRHFGRVPRSGAVLLTIAALSISGVLVLIGCNDHQHPDEKDAVNNALTANNLGAVSVSQDRDKGVMTL